MSEKNLEVKKSKIKGSGKGLFTKVHIKKGKLINQFTGKLIKNEKVEELNNNNKLLYLIEWDEKHTLNVENSNCLAKYANDAEGIKKTKGFSNNSEICFEKNKLFLRAIKDIEAGEEIYVSYGKEYWDNI